MTFPICENLKNRNGLNTHLKAGNGTGAQWRLSAGNLWCQCKNRVGFWTDPNQPFPRGLLGSHMGKRQSNCSAVQSPLQRLDRESMAKPRNP